MRPEIVRAKHARACPNAHSEARDFDSQDRSQPTSAVPRAARDRSRRFRLIALAVCLSIAVSGVAVALFSSAGGPARQTATSAPPPAASGLPSDSGAVGSGSRGSGLTSPTTPKAVRRQLRRERQIRRWNAGPGGVALSAVETHMGTVMQAAGMKLYGTMRLACISLASDVRRAQTGPPIPDKAQQRLYAIALSGLSRAAADCRATISVHAGSGETTATHVKMSLLNRTRAEFATMAEKLYKATGALQSA